MAHDVFISYASGDKPIGDAVCAALEARGVRCWIAPRDILPGVAFSEAIVGAIQASRVFVLVFSSRSNTSPHVMREVERAVSRGIPIIPLRIEDVPLSPSMEYFISTPHWLDALTPPLRKHLVHLADTVALLLARAEASAADVTAGAATATPATVAVGRAPRPALPYRLPTAPGLPAVLVAIALIAVLGLAGWAALRGTAGTTPSVTPSPSVLAAGPTATGATSATSEKPQSAEPSDTGTGQGLPILEDAAFLLASAQACEAARPADGHTLTSPTKPITVQPGYQGLHTVVLEMRTRDGSVGPRPELPPGEIYYNLSSSTARPDLWSVLPDEAAQVDLLACVVLRQGASADYTIGNRSVNVTGLDAVVWMVDRRQGTRVDAPWVEPAELGTLVNTADLLSVGGQQLLPADVFKGIVAFMGLAGPTPGTAYQGGAAGWVVAEYDKPADLPPGTRLLSGYTFVVRLVVLADRRAIDFIDILCAPSGRISGSPLRVASQVPLDLGQFRASSADIRIDGVFSTSVIVSGTLTGASPAATDCGVPRSSGWQAALAMSARSDGSGGYVLYLPGQR